MNKLKIISTILIFLGCGATYAQTAVLPVYSCENPGVKAITSGSSSSNFLQGVIPTCTVTVYLTGTTTKATIYKNSTNTPQNNPFTANTNGSIPPIYAGTGQAYDVVLSGGIPPNVYVSPVTLTGLQSGGGSSSGVSQIIAGTNITITPSGGTGVVTINSTGGGGGSGTVTNVSGTTSGGFVVSTTNPTTTPAISVAVDGTHVLPTNTGSATTYLNGAGSYSTPAGGGGGTVNSVGLALPVSVFTISGSPVTNSGTLTGTFNSQTSSTLFAAPCGTNGTPSFRALCAGDIPALSGYILSAPGAGVSQSITQLTGTDFGISLHNWQVANGISAAFYVPGLFDTYTGDTGGSSVNGAISLLNLPMRCYDPGWSWGTANPNGAMQDWQACTAYFGQVFKGSAGIGNGIQATVSGYAIGDNTAVGATVEPHGGYTAGSDEGDTAIKASVVDTNGTSGVIVTGGTDAQTITVNGAVNLGAGRMAVDTTVAPITTTQTVSGSINGAAIATVGVTLPASTCGPLAGGPLVAISGYSIDAFNTVTMSATNNLTPGTQIILSGFTTSASLFNGNTYFVSAATGTTFSFGFAHAAKAFTAEAGFFATTGVPVLRQSGIGTVLTTFGITLGSAYTIPGGTHPLMTAWTAANIDGFADTFRILSTVSYTGGVQYVTANLRNPISAGSELCIGGLAGYAATSSASGYYNMVFGSTPSSAYEGVITKGSTTGGSVSSGAVSFYPMATVWQVDQTFSNISLSENNGTWTTGQVATFPNGIAANHTAATFLVTNNNPFAINNGVVSLYAGVPQTNPQSGFYAGGSDPSTLFSHSGNGYYAVTGLEVAQIAGIGMLLHSPPSDAHSFGNPQRNAAIYVGQECAGTPYACATAYDLIYDNDGTGGAGFGINMNISTETINVFGQGSGHSGHFTINGVAVCQVDGTNCPASGSITLAGVAAGTAPSSSGTYNFNNNALSGTATLTLTGTSSGINLQNGANTFGLSSAGTTFGGLPTVVAASSATSGANINSGSWQLQSSYWNGTAAAPNTWSLTDVLGTGTNPTSTLTFFRAGANTGVATVSIPRLFLGNITAGNCLQASTGGLVIDTGAACGSGGGGITALTGDVTASGSGSVVATLATVSTTFGTCGDATHVCQIVTNAKGLTTSQTAVAITGGTGTVTSIATTGPITGGTITTTGTIACPTCGVTGSPLSQFAATTSAQLAGVISNETGTSLLVFNTSPTLVTPILGAATATSLLATGNIDGTAPVTITTGTTATLGGTFKSGYTFNNEGTTTTAVTYTLPVAAAGLQYCVANLPTETGVLTIQTSGTGQFIGRAGVYGTTGGHAASAGALGDSACVIGVDATHWLLYPQTGTWVNP